MGSIFSFRRTVSFKKEVNSQIALIFLSITVGIATGIFAVIFIKSVKYIGKLKRRFSSFPIFKYPVLYLVSVCVVTGLVTMPKGIGDFMALSPYKLIRDLLQVDMVDCEHCNSKMWGDIGGNVIYALIILFVIRFVLTAFHISCPIPIGLYVTNLLIGMAMGRLIGEGLAYTNLGIPPAAFTLIGGSAYIPEHLAAVSSLLSLPAKPIM